jgi:hypothetical protein
MTREHHHAPAFGTTATHRIQRDRSPVTLSAATSVDGVGEAIAALAARLHSATYELLVLLREFDDAAGWNNGFVSCAHWLHWRTGIDLGAAREKVRVAHALASLPLVSGALERGRISYAKVRALTRVATPATETRLLELAYAGTTAHVERLVRAWRRCDREATQDTERRQLHRELSTWLDDDGMLIIRGRLTPELGAVVQRALDAAADRLSHAAREVSPTSTADDVTAGQRRADALGLLAECALSGTLDRGTAGDRYQVVLHLDTTAALPGPAGHSARAWSATDGEAPLPGATDTTVRRRAPDERANHAVATQADLVESEAAHERDSGRSALDATTERAALDVNDHSHAVLEIGDGAVYVSQETSRRITCDAAVVVMRHGADGVVLDVGPRTRTIPPAIRRALAARDTRCRFPGCQHRRCDAHHITHWADGGATSLDNLMLLCRRHHRLLHEGGFHLAVRGDGHADWIAPNGQGLYDVPESPRWREDGDEHSPGPLTPVLTRLSIAHVAIDGHSLAVWDGTPFHVGHAIDVLRGQEPSVPRTRAIRAVVRQELES